MQLTYNSLLKLKKSIVYEKEEEEEEEEKEEGPLEGFKQQVDIMLFLLGLKLEGHQV